MTPELADKIMTRIIARVEADGGVLHKSSGIEEIIGTCAVAEAEGEIIDIISHDGEKWVHKDGTAFDVEKSHERFLAEGFVAGAKWTPEELAKMSDHAAIQKTWHRVLTECMAWPSSEVIQARINKILEAK